MIILVYFLCLLINNKNMKNKKNKSINSSSNIFNNSNNYLSLISREIPFEEGKKESSNKSTLHYYSRKQKSRQINSLDELTKKFMKCVLEAESKTINLNAVMKKIRVKKRRIYDITNVLEGKYKQL
jgi:hypothetical protein